MINQVFLSYRHESREHARSVRRLGELLRQSGIPVCLDQFYLDENPGGPDERGWPKWCADRATQCACVVIVGSEGWFEAYDGTATDKRSGLGAATEAALFEQELYDEKRVNQRIRIALLHEVSADKISKGLKGWHQFKPFASNEELDQLIRWVAGRLKLSNIQSPTVQWPAPFDDFKPDIANRNLTEWPAVVNMLAGRSQERIQLFKAASGLGKSELLRQAVKYAKKIGVPVAQVNFKGTTDVAGVLESIDLGLGSQLPTFSGESLKKTALLRKDLRALRQPALIVFDHYEEVATNKVLVDWLTQQFLEEVETALGLTVIIAGQEIPPPQSAGWSDFAKPHELTPINEVEHWVNWIKRRYPEFESKQADLRTVIMVTRGNPSLMVSACEAIAGHC